MMKHSKLCHPRVEPESIAWKATMLAATPLNIWFFILFGVLMMRHSKLCQPGVEPGSIAWKATMLAATPLTLVVKY